jgi:hypothetical protein
MVDTRIPPGETAGMKGLAIWSETRTLMRSSLLRITSKDCPFTDGYSGCSDCEVQQGIHEVATLDPNITEDFTSRIAICRTEGRPRVGEESINGDFTNSPRGNTPLPSLARLSDENRCLPAPRTTQQPFRFKSSAFSLPDQQTLPMPSSPVTLRSKSILSHLLRQASPIR